MKKPASEGIYLTRTLDGFAFSSEYDRELGSRWPVGTVVRADLHAPRSGKQQRWYRALVRTVWRHQDHYASPEAMHKAIQYRLGYFDLIQLHNGEALIEPRSTAFDKMEDGEFREFVDRSWEVIAREIIPGLDLKGQRELVKEIDALVLGSLK
jgi:hypothetical protein